MTETKVKPVGVRLARASRLFRALLVRIGLKGSRRFRKAA